MKAILSMALVLGVCGLAGAADKVDPGGTWKCEYAIGDQKRMSTLTIKKDGDKLAGTMSCWVDGQQFEVQAGGYVLRPASGSSSSAAAAVARRLGWVDPRVTVHMPGGTLEIEIGEDFAITMTGPAVTEPSVKATRP